MIEVFKWNTPPEGVLIEDDSKPIYVVSSNMSSYTIMGNIGTIGTKTYKPTLRIKDIVVKDGNEVGGKGYPLSGDKAKNVCEALIAFKVMSPEELNNAIQEHYPEAYDYIRSDNKNTSTSNDKDEVKEEDLF